MAFITADRVLDSSTSIGTGAFVVSGTPAAGYQTFSSVMSIGDTCYYSIQGQTTSEWEVGLGTYSSANTLTRTTIYSSSNAGSAVTFSAGTKNVFLTLVASRSIQLDASGNVTPATGTYTRTTITATAGQTSFTANYTVNYVEVYVNGILLNSADYTATTGTTVVLAAAAAAGDIIDVFAINIGTFTGGVTITGTPTNGQIATWTGSTSLQGTTILPTANGGLGASLSPTTAGNTIFSTDGTNWSSTQKIVQGTSQATTSGTSITFTGIPSWVKRVTVMLSGVSVSGASVIIAQIGSGSVTTTGYLSYVANNAGAGGVASATYTTGFATGGANAANLHYSAFSIFAHSGFTYLSTIVGGINSSGTYSGYNGGGNVTLGGALDRVRLTTVNGTDTFDAGSVNILYE